MSEICFSLFARIFQVFLTDTIFTEERALYCKNSSFGYLNVWSWRDFHTNVSSNQVLGCNFFATKASFDIFFKRKKSIIVAKHFSGEITLVLLREKSQWLVQVFHHPSSSIEDKGEKKIKAGKLGEQVSNSRSNVSQQSIFQQTFKSYTINIRLCAVTALVHLVCW